MSSRAFDDILHSIRYVRVDIGDHDIWNRQSRRNIEPDRPHNRYQTSRCSWCILCDVGRILVRNFPRTRTQHHLG